MRKLKLQVQVSVDGYMAGPKNEIDWMVWDWDDEIKRYVNKITDPVDCILLGRVLAEGFIDAWAARANEAQNEETGFIRKMNETPKIVFSDTLQYIDWKNTTLVNGELAEEINSLKKQPGSDLIAYGGTKFVASLIKEDLIDEYHLFINPVVLGNGKPVFHHLNEKINLNLIQSQSFACGITVLQYAPKRN